MLIWLRNHIFGKSTFTVHLVYLHYYNQFFYQSLERTTDRYWLKCMFTRTCGDLFLPPLFISRPGIILALPQTQSPSGKQRKSLDNALFVNFFSISQSTITFVSRQLLLFVGLTSVIHNYMIFNTHILLFYSKS